MKTRKMEGRKVHFSATREAPGKWRGWVHDSKCGMTQNPDTHPTKREAVQAIKERY